MWGVCCNGNGLVNAYSKKGKTSDPFFLRVVWPGFKREGFLFLWIGSVWSVHCFSLPTVVSPWTKCCVCSFIYWQLFAALWIFKPYPPHESTNITFCFWFGCCGGAGAHLFVLSSFSFLPLRNTILQMLKTWNLSSTLTTPTTLRTISTALAEQHVAKRQARLIPSSLQTTWGRPVTSSLCSARPTRQSTPSSSKWRKSEEVNLIGEIQKLCCELQPLLFSAPPLLLFWEVDWFT